MPCWQSLSFPKAFSMAEIVSKEAQKKSKAGICLRFPSHNKHTSFLLSKRSTSCKSKTSAINRAFYLVLDGDVGNELSKDERLDAESEKASAEESKKVFDDELDDESDDESSEEK
ncbi:hypothetical protein Tco_1360128 [Tanacetum coccineum]